MFNNTSCTTLLVGLLVFCGSTRPLFAQHGDHEIVLPSGSTPAVTNPLCPVLEGEPIDPEIYTEHDGELVFLCCRKCLKQFESDPMAFASNLPAAMAPAAHQETEGDHDDHGSDEAPQQADIGHSDAEEHDHSQHKEGTGGGISQILERVGRLHPMVIHFPIALLLLAALAEFLVLRGAGAQFAFAARFCLWAGALGALVAAPLGWADASAVASSYTGFSAELLDYHRWTGTSTALMALLTLGACERYHRSEDASWRNRYRIGLALCALLVSVAGHLGASLIYGWEYLLP